MSSYRVFSKSIEGQPWRIFPEDADWWDENPIVLSQEEIQAIDFPHVSNFLIPKDLSPLRLVSIDPSETERDPVLNTIETLYRRALKKNLSAAKAAYDDDVTIAKQLNESFKKKLQSQTSHTLRSAGIGAAFGIIGAIPGYFIGAGKDRRQNEENQEEKLRIQREASTHRRSLLVQIDKREKKRYVEIKVILQKAGAFVQEQLQKRSFDPVHDDSLLKKYRTYERMFRTFFPNSSFVLEQSSDLNLEKDATKDVENLNFDLQPWVAIKFFSVNHQKAKSCGEKILTLAKRCQNSGSARDLFLTEIAKIESYDEINSYLGMLETICSKNLQTAFFQCVSTKQVKYYCRTSLIAIVKQFEQLAQFDNVRLKTPFPAFDEGGRNYLQQLTKSIPNRFRVNPKKFSEEVSVEEIDLEEAKIINHRFVIPNKQEVHAVLERFAGKDQNVKVSLSEEKILLLKSQYTDVLGWCDKWKESSLNELRTIAESISEGAEKEEIKSLQFVALGCLAIYKQFRKSPYPEQVLTVLAKLTFPKGCVAQVKTGEGKTLIHTLLTFVLALKGKTVHLISSSANLSIRDQKSTYRLFNFFGIETSHICEQQPNASKFRGKVIYGRVHDFEFAVMREWLNDYALFPQPIVFKIEKRFDCVVIDELDNLMIDTALNHARLSYQSENAYEWIYLPIFQFVEKFIDKEAKAKLEALDTLKDLRKFLKSTSQGRKAEEIENLSDLQLKTWLKSAHQALYIYKEKQRYVVKEVDKKKKVWIVDAENTGRILHGCRWSDGLHEFVELKHGCSIDKESLTPLSLSHAVFYQFYDVIYGLTGTLGANQEREGIKEIYRIGSFDVPTHLPCLREDMPTILYETNALHQEAILQQIQLFQTLKRPILVICETIGETENLIELLKNHKILFSSINELQGESEDDILERAGNPGAITIATNVAGRGIDIILKEESHFHGGLHVLITFFPESERVENQARARAGRQGQKGSSQLLISKEWLQKTYRIKDIATDQVEAYLLQIREISMKKLKETHLIQASLDRYCFERVMQFFSALRHFRERSKDEGFLNHIALYLSNLKLDSGRVKKLKVATPGDIQLRDRLIDLLLKRGTSSSFKLLLQEATETIEKRCLNAWSIHFNQKVEELFRDSEAVSKSLMLRHVYQTLMNLFEKDEGFLNGMSQLKNPLKEAVENSLERTLQQQVDQTFNDSQKLWARYLDRTGKGFLFYFEDLIGIPLS